jgi:hypothetical protein
MRWDRSLPRSLCTTVPTAGSCMAGEGSLAPSAGGLDLPRSLINGFDWACCVQVLSPGRGLFSARAATSLLQRRGTLKPVLRANNLGIEVSVLAVLGSKLGGNPE